MLFSIITVNYNNAQGLETTIKSTLAQTYPNFELIIIDGKSSDNSVDIAKQYKDSRVLITSEKDLGIFDAMNKGISKASGEWLIFMNSGDCFVDSKVLQKVADYPEAKDSSTVLMFGDKQSKYGESIKAIADLEILHKGELFACHQSIYFRPNISYDLRYKIFGDYDLLARIYNEFDKSKMVYLKTPISRFEGEGISSKISIRKRREKFLAMYRNFGVKNIVNYYLLNPKVLAKIFKWK